MDNARFTCPLLPHFATHQQGDVDTETSQDDDAIDGKVTGVGLPCCWCIEGQRCWMPALQPPETSSTDQGKDGKVEDGEHT